MAKVKFNVKGVEVRAGGGEPIPRGVYKCQIETCQVTEPPGKDQRIELVYVVAEGDYKGRKLFDYVNLVSEASAFKVREFLEAVGIVSAKKETGEFDPAKQVGEFVMIRVAHQTDKREGHEGEVQSRVGSTFAIGAGEDEAPEDDDLDDDDDDDEDDDEVDLDELDRAALKKLIKDEELGIRVTKGMSDDDVRKAIAEAMSDDEDEDEDDEDEDDEDDDSVDLDELDRAELKKLIKEQELEISVKKSMSDDDVRKAIAEALGGDDDDDDDEDDDEVDYTDLDLEQLKATLKERGLSVKGSKKILIARLEKDDEAAKDGKDPF